MSENCDFVKLCEQNNIKFIGPPFDAISAMGSKIESKKIMEKAKVPVVPGYYGDNQDKDFLIQKAREIEYPIMIKADLGGGGKGMRIVRNENEFYEQLNSAQNESSKSFNSTKMLLEKYIANSKHIEVQVMGDNYKNYVHLFERDCTIQRRHQKVVEEAPSYLDNETRLKLCNTAVKAAEAVGYVNAGTVEFIYDIDFNKFYFMEMNTRLQVEHPITEMITRQDLVEWQLLIAAGNKLPLKQEEIKIHGHAIEARIYSEDPSNNFLPGSGKIKYLREPNNKLSKDKDENVRIETGVREGDEVSVFYDPMISKLVCWAPSRDLAIKKTLVALENYKILGLPNNIKFCQTIINHPQFQKWDFDTNFIGKNIKDLIPEVNVNNELSLHDDIIALVLSKIESEINKSKNNTSKYAHIPFLSRNSPWLTLDSFRINHKQNRKFKLVHNSQKESEKPKFIEVTVEHSNNKYTITIGKDKKYENLTVKSLNKDQILVTIPGHCINRVNLNVSEDGNIKILKEDGGFFEYVIKHFNFYRILWKKITELLMITIYLINQILKHLCRPVSLKYLSK